MGLFSSWQPIYAERGIPTFPVVIVDGEKRPAVRNYMQFGLKSSCAIVDRFPAVDALGFGVRRAGITVLDVDTSDERVLAEALDRHGPTPIIAQSGSGNFHCWYKNGGERRLIRPWPDLPIDVLGDGYIVAPPSKGMCGDYEFIQGTLDDIASLPTMRAQELIEPARGRLEPIPEGKRNDALFRHCMAQAVRCPDWKAMLDVARTFAADFAAPMPEAEVVKTARSAWGYQERGENRVGQRGEVIGGAEADRLLDNPDALVLLITLRRQNHRGAGDFAVPNGMRRAMAGGGGWPEKRFASARRHLVNDGTLVCVRPPSQRNGAATYRWGQN